MNRAYLIVPLLFCGGIAATWLLPVGQPSSEPIKAGSGSGRSKAGFYEPELKQIEEARFFLDKETLRFGTPPAPPPVPTSPDPTVSNGAEVDQEPGFAWRFVGVIQTGYSTKAVFSSGTKSKSVPVGARIDEWRLVAVRGRVATLRSGKFTRTMELFAKSAPGPDSAAEERIAGPSSTEAARSMKDFGPVQRDPAWVTNNNALEPR